jgi:hypothetical protein
MGPLPFLFPTDAPERKKERGPRRGGGGGGNGSESLGGGGGCLTLRVAACLGSVGSCFH